jgi:hypothetical protein
MPTTCLICTNYMYGVVFQRTFGVVFQRFRKRGCGVSADVKCRRISKSVVFQRLISGGCGVSAWKTFLIHRVSAQANEFPGVLAGDRFGRNGGFAGADFERARRGPHVEGHP